jgi:hypothetical protein
VLRNGCQATPRAKGARRRVAPVSAGAKTPSSSARSGGSYQPFWPPLLNVRRIQYNLVLPNAATQSTQTPPLPLDAPSRSSIPSPLPVLADDAALTLLSHLISPSPIPPLHLKLHNPCLRSLGSLDLFDPTQSTTPSLISLQQASSVLILRPHSKPLFQPAVSLGYDQTSARHGSWPIWHLEV